MTRRVTAWLSAVVLVLALVSCATVAPRHSPTAGAPIVVLVSIDGWRWDYLEKFAPPAISRLAAQGVRARGLIPVFPSKTFPNHYSIVTGLYPEHHGIISNNMVDPGLPGRFRLAAPEVLQDTRWWGGEPIWITAERQGQRAATMFWPGSDVEIAGDRPAFYEVFDNDLPNPARVDRVLAWLNEPAATRPTFLTLYFGSVDHFGHEDGPESPVTREAVAEVDAAMARLLAGIERAGLSDRTHLILVSDHGMAALSRERTIVLDDYLDLTTVDIVDSSPVAGLNPVGSTSIESIYASLRDKHPALRVFTKTNLPAEYRLRNHPRLPAVIGIADDGWHITTRETLQRNDGEVPGGTHGYDPKYQSMHGLFIATGPQFRRGVVVPAFENVHIYELMCRVLGLRPAPNDGSRNVTASFLR